MGVMAFALSFAALMVACQFFPITWQTTHDTYRILPFKEWSLESGLWDSLNVTTHVHTGGNFHKYVFVERTTNTH
jgi:hypothetical protein